MATTAPVLIRTFGALGRIALNRPDALHALNTDMCRAILAALLAWRGDETVTAVLIDHAEGTRGFCAGGDIRMLSDAALSAAGAEAARDFFHTEYRMNWLLKEFGKPIVAAMDGVVMGGGVGVAMPCRFRIATERTTFAMPESAIGLFPDVGGGWWLPRLPGRTGVWLALTGARLKAADCLHLGIATHFMSAEGLAGFRGALVAATPTVTGPGESLEGALHADALADLLKRFAEEPGAAPVAERQGDIDRLFASDRLEDILAALEADGSDWAQAQLAAMRRNSPQAMKVALRQLETGATLPTFADNMAMEYRLATRIVLKPDFREGVRSVLVDKDGQARWSPPTPEAVGEGLLDELFARLPADQEWTPPEI